MDRGIPGHYQALHRCAGARTPLLPGRGIFGGGRLGFPGTSPSTQCSTEALSPPYFQIGVIWGAVALGGA